MYRKSREGSFHGCWHLVKCKFCGKEEEFHEIYDYFPNWQELAEENGWDLGDYDGDDICLDCTNREDTP